MACPWLPKRKFRMYEDSKDEDDDDQEDDLEREPLAGWPEYLWDSEKSCTIPTRTLGYDRPAYTAISHTWGRGAQSETAYILGGLKSPIPENENFDVTGIPKRLDNLRGQLNTNYVWLDLVCVPQGGNDELNEEDEQIRLQEIGREDLIFRNAAASVAWLHDVEDLSCLAALFQWLSLSMLELDNDSEQARWRERLMDGLLERIKGHRTGLSGHEDFVELHRSNSWFTSLWTFQELCLRPDMLLATSSLDIMSLDNGQHIPLNGIMCVYNRYVSSMEPPEEISVAMKDMSDWCHHTGLDQLPNFTQIDVLKLAKSRYCKGSRAEAIMSVFGATEWFKKLQAKEGSARQGIQTQYHPEFVKEVRDRMPEVIPTTPMKYSGAETNERSKHAQKIVKTEYGETFTMYYYDSAQLQEVVESLLE